MKFKIIFLLVITLTPSIVFAWQKPVFTYNKSYYECEDKWVTHQSKKDTNNYSIGFIYLDLEAGYTLQYYSSFSIDADENYILDTTLNIYSIKVRLENELAYFLNISDEYGFDTTINTANDYTNAKYAIIPDGIIEKLKLPKEPDWLKLYRIDDNPVKSMTKRGYHLNHLGRSDLAIPFLENAYELSKDSSDLNFELSYAYNATKQFEKAYFILDKAVAIDTNNVLLLKELAYALTHLQRFSETEQICLKILDKTDDNDLKCETMINLIGIYYRFDIEKAKYWYSKCKQYVSSDSRFKKHIDMLGERLGF